MMDKKFRIFILSSLILALSFVGPASATTWSVDDSGGADFTRIQDAINNASVGDTILVYSGVYYEKVVVDKSVTLKGIGYPVVDATGNAITLRADGIRVEGFNATRGICDIFLDESNSNNIIDNNASILLSKSCNNTIISNNLNNNDDGIKLCDWSNNNTFSGNNVSNNKHGIHLSCSCNNTIIGNTFVNVGLCAGSSYNNIVEDNIVNGKPLVYLKDASNYKVEDAGQVILMNCTNITVENMDLYSTWVGVVLWTCCPTNQL